MPLIKTYSKGMLEAPNILINTKIGTLQLKVHY
jgi:hypothetical protein